MTYDLIIIGGGPAGTAAAVYSARKQLKTLLIAEEFGGQSIVSEKIYNWIGTPEISGAELAKDLRAHVAYYEGEFLQVKTGVRAEKIEKNDKNFLVKSNNESFETRSVLIASGSGRRKLDPSVVGAEALEHKGLTYCASCDGPLFSDQDVAVLGGGNAALETVAQLLAYCKSVTIIHRSAEFRADEITVEKVLKNPKAKAIMNAQVTKILGEKFVTGLKYKDTEGGEHNLPVTGIFVEIGQIPNTNFAEGVVEMNNYKQIKIDPRTQMTNVPGIWASGDCTDVLYHQNNIAAGDAVRALEDIYQWLHKNS